jgi:hypothetical protein
MMHTEARPGYGGMMVGLVIVLVGIVLFLDQTGVLGWTPTWSFWPLLLVMMGLARFAQPRADGGRDGGWLIFIGLWLLLNEMRVLRYRDSWPLFLVALGVHTMWKAVRRQAPQQTPSAPTTGGQS